MREVPVFFDTEDRLRLEGRLSVFDDKKVRHGVVLCHPHPLMGGDMGNIVITTIAGKLYELGVITLRFNFRGVGKSTGRFGGGIAEVNDVKGAIDHLAAQDVVDENNLALVGYSFGSTVVLRTVSQDRKYGIKKVVGIAVPITDTSLIEGALESLGECTIPKLFICGDNDHVCPVRKLRAVVDGLPKPKSFKIIEGADHFFGGKVQEVAEGVGAFVVE